MINDLFVIDTKQSCTNETLKEGNEDQDWPVDMSMFGSNRKSTVGKV